MSYGESLAMGLGLTCALIVGGLVFGIVVMPMSDPDIAIEQATEWCENKNGRAENIQPEYNLLYCYFTVTTNVCNQTDVMTTHYQESIDKVIVSDGISKIHANGDVIIMYEELSLDVTYVGNTIVYDKTMNVYEQTTNKLMPDSLYNKYKYDIPFRGWVYEEHKMIYEDFDKTYEITSKYSECATPETIELLEIRS